MLIFFLVRSPTPLAPFFSRYLKTGSVVFLIVGEYNKLQCSEQSFRLHSHLVNLYNLYLKKQFEKAISTTPVLVNSKELFNKYKSIQSKIFEVRTTTLSQNDLFFCTDWDWKPGIPIKVLYTGRITPEKGLNYILKACIGLTSYGFNVEFHLAGMIIDREGSYIKYLQNLAQESGFAGLRWHGLKTVGNELNLLYRECHIFVTATIVNEGFPRTIWEAMANSLPVIATNVGGIPHIIKNKESGLLVPPKNKDAITNGILELIENNELRKKIIEKGYLLSSDNTLELQTNRLVNFIIEL